tara:strand:- start:207 stop:845 length:639 start_codon:yes stop_codon:yes gene_type:complete
MPKRCKKCGELGHNSRTCGRKKNIVVVVKKGKRICKNCGKSGHNIRTCPLIHGERVVVEKKPSNRVCSICGKRGHNSRTCLKKKLTDTVVVIDKRKIRTNFVDENDYLGYLKIEYDDALKDIIKYPMILRIIYFRNYDSFIELAKISIDGYYLYIDSENYVELWIKNRNEYSVSRGKFENKMKIRSYYSTDLKTDIEKRRTKYERKYKHVYG